MLATRFRQNVVASVAVSCLLTMDYVPNSKPPDTREMVQNELPRILNLAPGISVPPFSTDPAALLESCVSKLSDDELTRASALVLAHGHEDMVFSALQYMRKPPTATSARIRRMTRAVSQILNVEIPDTYGSFIGDLYVGIHKSLIKI